MYQLDEVDRKILALLQTDAEVTHKEMGVKLHKSAATIHERVRRMKEDGYIRRIVAVVDSRKVNKSLITFAHVSMNDHTSATLTKFEQEVTAFPEVMECFQMTGSFDFLLRITSADMNEYQQFYRARLANLPNISKVESYFVLTEIKSDTAFPL